MILANTRSDCLAGSHEQPTARAGDLAVALAALRSGKHHLTLSGIKRGLEKESLRITPSGTLAQTPHAPTLGSALKHPHITTDYSEALLEFITDPWEDIAPLLDQLDQIHRFTYQQLAANNERLWPASMPCELPPDSDIPVARYGSSNSGVMKTIYRLGLGHRYGRSMQTIAGIHYNFSLPDNFWQALQALEGDTQPLQDFKTAGYFRLIRNFRRHVWLLVYLFGASPVATSHFVEGRPHRLQPMPSSPQTHYLPEATALRMGDLGYQSDAQQALFVCYNTLPNYLRTLCSAITQAHPAYETIGLKDGAGRYQQLSTSLLQIENEFYSSIRPKRTTESGETALQALRLRGVEYVEVRCVDLNPYLPLGVTAEQLRVYDAFLLHCLLSDNAETSRAEYAEGQENQKRIVYQGRDPQLQLLRRGEAVDMRTWAKEILDGCSACAALIDLAKKTNETEAAVKQQMAKLDQPELTPSAQVLRDLEAQQISFAEFVLGLAEQHRHYFSDRPLAPEQLQAFEQQANNSLAAQAAQEAQTQLPFEVYLANYYRQYHDCSCC